MYLLICKYVCTWMDVYDTIRCTAPQGSVLRPITGFFPLLADDIITNKNMLNASLDKYYIIFSIPVSIPVSVAMCVRVRVRVRVCACVVVAVVFSLVNI